MTFSEVLPHLINGRIAHWHSWDYKLLPDGMYSHLLSRPDAEWVKVPGPLTLNILSSNEWELVDEATPTPTPCDSCLKERNELKAQVKRLEVEWNAAHQANADLLTKVGNLTRDLDNLKISKEMAVIQLKTLSDIVLNVRDLVR